MNTDSELDRWQQEWQKSSPATADVEVLLAKAHRRNRVEKVVMALEVLLGLVVIAGCLATALTPDLHVLERALLIGLAALAGGFILWVFRQRRRNWLHLPMDAARLIELERQRLHTRIRYWQVNLWGVLGLWILTLTVAVINALYGNENATKWAASSVALLAVVVATGLLSAAIRKRAQRQLEQLDALDSSLT